MGVSLDCAPSSHGAGFGVNFVVMKFAAAVIKVAVLANARCIGRVQGHRRQPSCSNGNENDRPHCGLHT